MKVTFSTKCFSNLGGILSQVTALSKEAVKLLPATLSKDYCKVVLTPADTLAEDQGALR